MKPRERGESDVGTRLTARYLAPRFPLCSNRYQPSPILLLGPPFTPFGLLSLHLSLHQVLQLQPCNTLNLLSLRSSRRLSGSSLVVTASRLSHSSSHTSTPRSLTPRSGRASPEGNEGSGWRDKSRTEEQDEVRTEDQMNQTRYTGSREKPTIEAAIMSGKFRQRNRK